MRIRLRLEIESAKSKSADYPGPEIRMGRDLAGEIVVEDLTEVSLAACR